jgi:hypothetical protein
MESSAGALQPELVDFLDEILILGALASLHNDY